MEIPDSGQRVRRLLAGLALVAVAAAQETPETTFRSTTKLVEITVVARDKQDRPVADLTQEDFEVLDNGRPQVIRLFETDTKRKPSTAAAPGDFNNRASSVPGERSGYTLLLLDALNTNFENQAFARQKAMVMLRTLPPGEKVALYVLGRGLRVAHQFTPDTEALARRLELERGESYEVPFDIRVRDTLRAFEQIANPLAGIAGEKTLLWVTAAFETGLRFRDTYAPAIERALGNLNNANVALHAVDARGRTPALDANAPRPKLLDPWPRVVTMMLFADQTAGRVYYGRNDIDVAMREAIDSLAMSYSLGYYQPEDGVASGDHRITVRVRRPGVDLRYRQSYTVEPPPKPSAKIKPAVSAMETALSAIVDSSAIPLRASVDRQAESLALHLHIEPGGMTFAEKEGQWHGALEILCRFTMAEGRQTGELVTKGIKTTLQPSSHDRVLLEGMNFGATLRIPAQAAMLRVAVRDLSSGQIGTLTISLGQVP